MINQDHLVIIEDKINEDTLYYQFKGSRKERNAKKYLQQYPKGKYSVEINKAVDDYKKREPTKQK